MQSLKNEDAENIGYVIPPPVIHHFLDDFERNGRYTGFPALGLEWQKMESPFLQKSMRMKVRPEHMPVRYLPPLTSLSLPSPPSHHTHPTHSSASLIQTRTAPVTPSLILYTISVHAQRFSVLTFCTRKAVLVPLWSVSNGYLALLSNIPLPEPLGLCWQLLQCGWMIYHHPIAHH